jgi:hypothetical protein
VPAAAAAAAAQRRRRRRRRWRRRLLQRQAPGVRAAEFVMPLGFSHIFSFLSKPVPLLSFLFHFVSPRTTFTGACRGVYLVVSLASRPSLSGRRDPAVPPPVEPSADSARACVPDPRRPLPTVAVRNSRRVPQTGGRADGPIDFIRFTLLPCAECHCSFCFVSHPFLLFVVRRRSTPAAPAQACTLCGSSLFSLLERTFLF